MNLKVPMLDQQDLIFFFSPFIEIDRVFKKLWQILVLKLQIKKRIFFHATVKIVSFRIY